jgi:hypothetical protein
MILVRMNVLVMKKLNSILTFIRIYYNKTIVIKQKYIGNLITIFIYFHSLSEDFFEAQIELNRIIL